MKPNNTKQDDGTRFKRKKYSYEQGKQEGTKAKHRDRIIELKRYLGFLNVVMAIIVCSFIGMSLPPTIAAINFNNYGYGTWASYFISICLFLLLTRQEEKE